jgi:hypothetical protein
LGLTDRESRVDNSLKNVAKFSNFGPLKFVSNLGEIIGLKILKVGPGETRFGPSGRPIVLLGIANDFLVYFCDRQFFLNFTKKPSGAREQIFWISQWETSETNPESPTPQNHPTIPLPTPPIQ